ncbi:MAG: GNAT family N-acetyltransferase [Elusimicrobiota bacterium]
MSWRAFGEDRPPGAWDEALESLPDYSVFQSEAWARHKATSGWRPVRALESEGGRPRAVLQALVKTSRAGAAVFWCRGGPVGEPSLWDEKMRGALLRAAGRTTGYLRLCPYRPDEPALRELMRSKGWSRPVWPLDRHATMRLDLGAGADALRRGLSGNWRHNLKRAGRRCRAVRRWEKPDPEAVLGLYRSMETYKGIAPHRDGNLASLLEHLGGSVILFRADDEGGAALALRGCAVQGKKAWDIMAATTPAGRRCYASYAAFWALIEECRTRGVRSYDLGGADPDAARGVYDFKRGTGARDVRYAGEWHWASPWPLRPLGDLGIRLLSGGIGLA